MVAVCDPGKCGRWLTLAAGRDEGNVLARHRVDRRQFVRAQKDTGGCGQVAEFLGDRNVLHHASPHNANPTVVPDGSVDNLLDARDQRRKGGDDDAPLGARENLFEGGVNHPLRRGVARPVSVSAVGKEAEDTLLSDLSKLSEVRRTAIDRSVVELEVAGVDDCPRRCLKCDAYTIRDAVADMKELGDETTEPDGLTWHDPVQGDAVGLSMFLEFSGNQAGSERSCPQRREIQLGKDVGKGADVVFVPVGEDDASYSVQPGREVRDIRDNQVDPEHLVLRKHYPAVDDDNIVIVFDDQHVPADFTKSAKGSATNSVAHVVSGIAVIIGRGSTDLSGRGWMTRVDPGMIARWWLRSLACLVWRIPSAMRAEGLARSRVVP